MFVVGFIMSLIMILIVYFIFMILMYKNKMDMESMGAYECGFEPGCYTRMIFSYRFFLISILFIIFDVEISLMLPLPFLMGSEVSLWIFIFFLLVLIGGLLYEYMCGSLDWLEIMIKA